MAELVQNGNGRQWSRWRMVAWGLASLLLILPAVAMQFTSEVDWGAEDFVFVAVVVGTVGLIYELAVRMSRNWAYRGGVAAALAASFMILWANGAVGMVGDEGSAYTQLFYAVILLALIGSVASRFRAVGMSRTMFAAGIAHAAIGLGGIASDLIGGIFSTGFAVPWLVAGGLFALAARNQGKLPSRQ